MPLLLRIADGIDRFQERFGRVLVWLSVLMVLVGALNAVARYTDRFTGFGLSSNMWLELQWYLFSLLFLLGAAWTLKEDAHVRVDVFYGRLSARGKAWVYMLGTVFLMLPFCGLMLWSAWPAVVNSWAVLEASPDPGGLPRYPIKTVIPVAFLLLVLQGVSLFARSLGVILGANVDEFEDESAHGSAHPTPGGGA